MNVLLLLIGYFVAKFTGLNFAERKTVAIETGIQNSTLGIAVATLIVGAEAGFTAYSLPAAVYGVTMYFVTIPIILWLRRLG